MVTPLHRMELWSLGDFFTESDASGAQIATLRIEHNVGTEGNPLRFVDFRLLEPTDTATGGIRIILQFTFSRFVTDGTIEEMADE